MSLCLVAISLFFLLFKIISFLKSLNSSPSLCLFMFSIYASPFKWFLFNSFISLLLCYSCEFLLSFFSPFPCPEIPQLSLLDDVMPTSGFYFESSPLYFCVFPTDSFSLSVTYGDDSIHRDLPPSYDSALNCPEPEPRSPSTPLKSEAPQPQSPYSQLTSQIVRVSDASPSALAEVVSSLPSGFSLLPSDYFSEIDPSEPRFTHIYLDNMFFKSTKDVAVHSSPEIVQQFFKIIVYWEETLSSSPNPDNLLPLQETLSQFLAIYPQSVVFLRDGNLLVEVPHSMINRFSI